MASDFENRRCRRRGTAAGDSCGRRGLSRAPAGAIHLSRMQLALPGQHPRRGAAGSHTGRRSGAWHECVRHSGRLYAGG